MRTARLFERRVGTCALALSMFVVASGCRRETRAPEPLRPSQAVSSATVTSATMFPIAQPVRLDVAGDRPLRVAHAPPEERRVTVYLHGRCSTPDDDVAAIADVARAHGTLVALEADQPCGDAEGTRWTEDETSIQSRIDAALAAVARARGRELDADRLAIIGESQGASRAEALTRRYPDRYPFVVLVGAPATAQADSFERAAGIAIVAGERESQNTQSASVDVLRKAGKKTRFFEIPLATHGSFGTDGSRIIDEALTFVGR